MLSKPDYGWTDFSLGEEEYGLSYLTAVHYDWLNHAIYGLKHLCPFTVHGFCEAWRVLCTVSYWNCHIIFENDENVILDPKKTSHEIVHVNMIEFCQMLYDDISANIDEWANWNLVDEPEILERERRNISAKLTELKVLIDKHANEFNDGVVFW